MAIVKSSGSIAASGTSGHTFFITGLTVSETAGTSSITVTLYDNNAASGTIIVPAIKVAAGTSFGEDFAHPIMLTQKNCYVSISGSGTASVVVRGK